jgi:pimeloyl-ACP methyl ester carboxylesterase
MKLIFLLALLLVVLARDDPKYDALYRTPTQPLTNSFIDAQEMHWFSQIVDHYDYRQEQRFNQRYWVVDEYFNPRSGPVYLYICGEWICSGVPELRTWVGVLAQKTQGLVLVLEHRFYGDSLPVGKQSFTLENMRLLNSEQALRDLAFFIEEIKSTQAYGITNNPWVSVGGSYPGALSAWFRIKYPHLVIGSLASSAVVLAVEDFKDFDEQIYLSSARSGDFCWQALNASNHRVESILYSSPEAALEFKSQFPGGMKLTNDEFLFFWADSNVLTVQYGGRTAICQQLAAKNEDEQFEVIKQNALNFDVYEYSSYWLRN